jgi:PmbA protein
MSAAKKTRSVATRRASAAEVQLRPEREIHAITGRIFRIAKSLGLPEVEVHVDEVVDALTRFANNAIHQHVAEHGLTVSLRVLVDGRTARVTTNRTEEDSLRAALESAASLASSQPKDIGLLPLPTKQKYRAVRRFSAPTAGLSAEARARAVKNACSLAEKNGQIAAGIFSSGQSQSVLANSRGLFAPYRQTQAEFSVTMQQGSATSWAKANSADFRAFDPIALSKIASEKAARAENPVELSPGRYTVILEPAAVLDLVGFLFYDFSATAVRDQRSCFSGRLGKPLLGKNITITDDVYHPEQLGAPFDGEGIPRQRVTLVDAGVPQNLVYSRRAAKKAGKPATGHGFALPNEYGEAPMNLVVSGGKSSIPEMIAGTDRGLLVTRLWYIREVDPYEKIMTGMTRDGIFLVEKGKVTQAVRNFRFNQSILQMLGNVQSLGPAHRATAEESFEMVIPPMKISDFHFSEVTKF